MGKRIMVTRCGYVNVAGDVTDAEALEYVRRHLSPNDFDWEAQSLEALEVVEDVDDIECPYSATGTRSNQRKAVFVRLHRIRQGVESEIFDDDFIFFVPGDTRNVKLYAMEKFKKAAYAILTSRRAPILLRSLGTDVFNWGDFVAALDPTTESEFNFFHVVHVPQSAEFLRKKERKRFLSSLNRTASVPHGCAHLRIVHGKRRSSFGARIRRFKYRRCIPCPHEHPKPFVHPFCRWLRRQDSCREV